MDSEETLPALLDERSVMSCVDLGVTLNGGAMEGTPVLEPLAHSVLEMTLDGGPMEGMPVLEPLEHSVLEMAQDGKLIEDMSVLEPLEHSFLEVARNGRPMAGISVLEPLEHSVLDVDLDGRPLMEMSVLGPLEHSVADVAPVWGDCSLIKMTVLDPLEHSGLGVTDHVDLDSRPLEEMSNWEPLEHSVLSVALDGRPMEGIPFLEPLEHSVLEMALDSGLMEGMSVLGPLEHSVLEMTLDGSLMEGDVSVAGVAKLDPMEHLGVAKRTEMISAYLPRDAGRHVTIEQSGMVPKVPSSSAILVGGRPCRGMVDRSMVRMFGIMTTWSWERQFRFRPKILTE